MTDSTRPRRSWMKIVLIQLVLIPVLFVIADVVVGLATGYDSENTRSRDRKSVV